MLFYGLTLDQHYGLTKQDKDIQSSLSPFYMYEFYDKLWLTVISVTKRVKGPLALEKILLSYFYKLQIVMNLQKHFKIK